MTQSDGKAAESLAAEMAANASLAHDSLENVSAAHDSAAWELRLYVAGQSPKSLVRKLPEPLRKIIGDLSNSERVLVGLELRSAG